MAALTMLASITIASTNAASPFRFLTFIKNTSPFGFSGGTSQRGPQEAPLFLGFPAQDKQKAVQDKTYTANKVAKHNPVFLNLNTQKQLEKRPKIRYNRVGEATASV